MAGVVERQLFSDKASGAKDDRPGLEKALGFALPGDCLVVWKLDRLGRSLTHLLKIVTGLRDKGVGFRSLTEQMDTTTPHGELFFHIFGALAQYERALARERVRAGLGRRQTPGPGCARCRSRRKSSNRSLPPLSMARARRRCAAPSAFRAAR